MKISKGNSLLISQSSHLAHRNKQYQTCTRYALNIRRGKKLQVIKKVLSHQVALAEHIRTSVPPEQSSHCPRPCISSMGQTGASITKITCGVSHERVGNREKKQEWLRDLKIEEISHLHRDSWEQEQSHLGAVWVSGAPTQAETEYPVPWSHLSPASETYSNNTG